ncbi:MAG: DUF3667 domain-containing protein [Thermoflexibacter sp.]|jgi:hypothetical protein|nr:DUF3667 domain-containing protein [Thermoflexibacter sp.]
MSKNCLNCQQPLEQNFCPHCGQKATTHRYSLKQFFVQDFTRAVLNLEKGFFYTMKELFTRPGHSIREYVMGKRAKHFNFFTFIILIITIGHLIAEYFNFSMIDVAYYSDDKESLTVLEKVSKESPKLFKLAQIPFFAIFSFLIFKKGKQNFTEHLVLNSYKISAELVILIICSMLTIFYKNTPEIDYIFRAISLILLIYSTCFYYQYFSPFGYSKVGLFFRSLVTSLIINVIIAAVTMFAIGMKQGFEGR